MDYWLSVGTPEAALLAMCTHYPFKTQYDNFSELINVWILLPQLGHHGYHAHWRQGWKCLDYCPSSSPMETWQHNKRTLSVCVYVDISASLYNRGVFYTEQTVIIHQTLNENSDHLFEGWLLFVLFVLLNVLEPWFLPRITYNLLFGTQNIWTRVDWLPFQFILTLSVNSNISLPKTYLAHIHDHI